jgi:hypothetical protein
MTTTTPSSEDWDKTWWARTPEEFHQASHRAQRLPYFCRNCGTQMPHLPANLCCSDACHQTHLARRRRRKAIAER